MVTRKLAHPATADTEQAAPETVGAAVTRGRARSTGNRRLAPPKDDELAYALKMAHQAYLHTLTHGTLSEEEMRQKLEMRKIVEQG